MAVLALILALALAVYQPVAANSCPNATLTSPSDTANLTSSSSSCDEIDGTLTISPSYTGTLHLPNIQEITGDLTITNVAGLATVSFPDLETVGGSVTVRDNGGLTNLTLSGLQTVNGGLEVQGNNALESVNLVSLEDVGTGLTIIGGFSISLPNLDQITGDSKIAGADMPCGVFDRLAADGVFSGSYSCKSSGGNGLSAGAKAGIAIGVILIVLIVIAGIWLVWRRKRAAVTDEEQSEKAPYDTPGNTTKMGLKIPRKPFPPTRPSEPPVPMLDSGMIHEAPTERSPLPVYELDAGPQSLHQRPMHHE